MMLSIHSTTRQVLCVILLTIVVVVVDVDAGRSNKSGGLPRSTSEVGFYTEPWCPSNQIDGQGFLCHQYRRIPGLWEEDEPVKGKHNSKQSQHNHNHNHLMDIPAQIRQVPGDGNCLFNAIVVCLSKAERGRHYQFHDFEELRHCAQALREKAMDFLHTKKTKTRSLYLQGDSYINAHDLLEQFADQYGITSQEYCETMRQDGVWAGGPEIVALCNLLKRPIHLYELHVTTSTTENNSKQKQFCLRRMCCFGSPKYDSREAIHVLSADSRFPDVSPGRQLREGNHFLSVFPAPAARRQPRIRGGGKGEQQQEQHQQQSHMTQDQHHRP